MLFGGTATTSALHLLVLLLAPVAVLLIVAAARLGPVPLPAASQPLAHDREHLAGEMHESRHVVWRRDVQDDLLRTEGLQLADPGNELGGATRQQARACQRRIRD